MNTSGWVRLRGGELTNLRSLVARFRVSHAALVARLDLGEDPEAALAALGVTIPPPAAPVKRAPRRPARWPRARMIEFNGKLATVKDHARECGVHYRTALARLDRGWDPAHTFARPAPPDAPTGAVRCYTPPPPGARP